MDQLKRQICRSDSMRLHPTLSSADMTAVAIFLCAAANPNKVFMKRSPSQFVVEHKRRAKLSSNKPLSIWSDALGSELRQELARQDVSLIEASSPEAKEHTTHSQRPSSAAENPSRTGRILNVVEPPAESVPPTPTLPSSNSAPQPIPRSGENDPSSVRRPKREKQTISKFGSNSSAVDIDGQGGSDADERPSSKAPTLRSSYRQRRQAATGGLPIAERWKWNL